MLMVFLLCPHRGESFLQLHFWALTTLHSVAISWWIEWCCGVKFPRLEACISFLLLRLSMTSNLLAFTLPLILNHIHGADELHALKPLLVSHCRLASLTLDWWSSLLSFLAARFHCFAIMIPSCRFPSPLISSICAVSPEA